MFYETQKNNHGLRFNPMKALVVPRPIGWISTMSLGGEINLSPYSFFNLISVNPDIVAFASEGRKDSLVFAEERGEFVYNLATFNQRLELNDTANALPRGQSEFEYSKLASAPSRLVAPPRVKESPISLECKWLQTIPLRPLSGEQERYSLVLGQVIGVEIDDKYIKDGVIDCASMRPIARGGYHDYFVIDETNRFTLRVPHM